MEFFATQDLVFTTWTYNAAMKKQKSTLCLKMKITYKIDVSFKKI